jgi:hypothetical protein
VRVFRSFATIKFDDEFGFDSEDGLVPEEATGASTGKPGGKPGPPYSIEAERG